MSGRATGYTLLTLGLAALGGTAAWVATRPPAAAVSAPRPPRLTPCTLATVERGTLDLATTLTGRVQTLRRARVGFDIGGRIDAVLVREGDVVQPGQELARLDVRERQALLAVAQAAEERARKELLLLEAPTRKEELERLRAQAQATESDVRWTTGEERRLAPLVESGGVTRSSYESMVAQKRAAEARHEAARAALRLAEAGTRTEEIEVQRARVAEAERNVARAQTDLDRTVLKAPFAGQVVARMLAPGDAVQPGASVLELVDVEAREVVLDVPAHHALRVDRKGRVRLTVDERPEFVLETTLTSLIEDSDPRSGSQRAIVRLEPAQDPERVLRPGTFVRAHLTLLPLEGVLIVPADSVRRTIDGWLLVKAVPPAAPAPGGPGGGPPASAAMGHGAGGAPGGGMPPMPTAAFVKVRLIEQHEGRAAVETQGGGLEAGDRVVVVGADLAFEGSPLLERREGPPPGPPGAPPGGAPDAAKKESR